VRVRKNDDTQYLI